MENVRLHEELEKQWSEEDRNDGPEALRKPLLVRGSLEQESNAKIADQISRLVGPNICESTAQDIETLCAVCGPVLRFGSSSQDNLRCLRHRRQWGYV
jgi:hypothetical protein